MEIMLIFRLQMPARNRSAQCSNTNNRRSHPPVLPSNQFLQTSPRRGIHSQNLQSYEDQWQPSPRSSSRHTTVTNVKVLYTRQDAEDYIRSIFRLWEIDDQGDGKTFIHQLLERIDCITEPSDPPFAYLFKQDREICYVLVVVETKEDRIEIAYSYHCIPDDVCADDSNNWSRSLSQHLLDWFNARAREALRLPASIVSVMVNNQQTMDDFQNKQLCPEEQREPPSERMVVDQQQGYITNDQLIKHPNRQWSAQKH